MRFDYARNCINGLYNGSHSDHSFEVPLIDEKHILWGKRYERSVEENF